ncbi:MAG: NapC/NirT family cytochrome c [Verrucomicrobiota bacterium]
MSTEQPVASEKMPSYFRNWISFAGLALAGASLFSFLLLFVLDSVRHGQSPYMGILTYLVVPAFLIAGLALTGVGWWLRRRQVRRDGTLAGAKDLTIDLAHPRDRKILVGFSIGVLCFLLLSAVGSYQTYHFTESVQFCGQLCHTVMEPEFVTYQHGSHARVTCTECHIGSGATWFVRSKLAGSYQVYATMAKKYPTPIPTPVHNLRPAQDTCERCHWPKKFVGNLDRTYNYFLGEETNTFFSMRMVMRVGGADPSHGPVGGIHWHMNVGNKVEYIATDPARQKIPWVRTINAQGVVTEYRAKGFTNDISQYTLRSMDCVDCHNRPAHVYKSPNDAVNLAMSLGKIDARLPWVKTNAVFILTQPYATKEAAAQKIASFLGAKYPGPSGQAAIDVVQQIYQENFFPLMKASWKNYPNNIGHKDWPGCFRCHDDKHLAKDGKQSIKGNECNTCHVILAQGSGKELEQLEAKGQKFKHPGGDYDGLCNDCHTGGP